MHRSVGLGEGSDHFPADEIYRMFLLATQETPFGLGTAGVNPAWPPRMPSSSGALSLRFVEQPFAGPRLAVSTQVFEGPLELLLALVERERLDIFQVSLAKVTY